jgi:mRNA interferase MazF
MKRFLEWIHVKRQLDNNESVPPYVSEGDIWWASIGENVGTEIGGKSEKFSRPVLVFRKLSSAFYFIIPLTSVEKKGTWYVAYRHRSRAASACLHQARSIDYRRLYSKLGTMDDADFYRIREGFKSLYLR